MAKPSSRRSRPRPDPAGHRRRAPKDASAALPPGHAPVRRPRRARPWTLLAALTLVAAGSWAYATSFAGVFVYDDVPGIVNNPAIRSLWPLTEAVAAPAETTVSGRPVASLTLALNHALAPPDARDVMSLSGAAPAARQRFYRNVWGYHALNLLIHLLAGLALLGVVRRTLLSDRLRPRFGAAATPLAFVVALLWLVHPLQTESVTYIVQRVESLMGLFYLVTLYCAVRAAEPGVARAWWTAAAIGACALGMGSKEVMVTAPVMVWLWDVVFLGADRRRRALYAGLAATWVILVMLVAGETRPGSVGFGHGWTWWSYLVTEAGVVAHYLRLSVVPVPLVFNYGWPKAGSLAEVAPQAALLATLVALTVLALARRHPLGFAGAWFFGILAPTSSVLPIATEVASEHRMYLPLAAVVAVIVLAAFAGGRRALAALGAKEIRRRRIGLAAAVAAAGLAAVVLAGLTRERNRDYWSDESLWRDTVQKRPANAQAHVGYAVNLLARERWQEAEAELRVVLRIDPSFARAHMGLGSALCAQGKLAEGITHLERAIALDPRLGESYGLLGEAYASQGNLARAVGYLERAAEMLPDNPSVQRRAAWLLATSPENGVRDGAKAVAFAERAVALTRGESVLMIDTLAAAYAEQGRFADALAAIDRGLRLARAAGDTRDVGVLEQRLALYQAGGRLRDGPAR